jgi:hypothetical protein
VIVGDFQPDQADLTVDRRARRRAQCLGHHINGKMALLAIDTANDHAVQAGGR